MREEEFAWMLWWPVLSSLPRLWKLFPWPEGLQILSLINPFFDPFPNPFHDLVLSPGATLAPHIYKQPVKSAALSMGQNIFFCMLMTPSLQAHQHPHWFDDLQANINAITHWISGNHLTVNSSKTKCMLISRKCSQAHHLPPLYLNGSVIQPVKHYKYLGMWISSDLTWAKHLESVSCKARRLLGFMF